MKAEHHYNATIKWTGNKGTGTDNYRNYERSHEISIEHKLTLAASSDPAFRGDKTKHNPEDLLLSSLSSCHMLWYLHLCSEAGVIVTDYIDNLSSAFILPSDFNAARIDNATGILLETSTGGGQFTEVTLRPIVTVAEPHMFDKANELHKKANERCFIANSVNFPVKHIPTAKI
jgi:organic hydroperoxide reductase OsmC/OhrA